MQTLDGKHTRGIVNSGPSAYHAVQCKEITSGLEFDGTFPPVHLSGDGVHLFHFHEATRSSNEIGKEISSSVRQKVFWTP